MIKAFTLSVALIIGLSCYGQTSGTSFMSQLPSKKVQYENCTIEGLDFPQPDYPGEIDDDVLYLERGTDYQKNLGFELCESEFQVLSLTVPEGSKLTVDFSDRKDCRSPLKGTIKSTLETDNIQLQHACFSGRLKIFEHRIQFKPVSKALKAQFLSELGVDLDDTRELLMTCELVQGHEVINCPYEEED